MAKPLAAFLLGLALLAVGALLAFKAAHGSTPNIFGWAFLAAGVVGLLTALALLAGAYDR